jgi:hypothetical protein
MKDCHTEKQKGRYIAICWSIFSLGAVVGSASGLGENVDSTARAVGSSTYVWDARLSIQGVDHSIDRVSRPNLDRSHIALALG